jgi:hypothetical protein
MTGIAVLYALRGVDRRCFEEIVIRETIVALIIPFIVQDIELV